jgi:hypothetical protein
MTLKQNDSHHCGQIPILCTPKSTENALRSEYNVDPYYCYHHPGIVLNEASPTYHVVNQAYYLEIMRHMKIRYEENDRKCGMQELGNSITTLQQLAQHCQIESSWQSTEFLSFHSLPNCLTYSFQTSFYS